MKRGIITLLAFVLGALLCALLSTVVAGDTEFISPVPIAQYQPMAGDVDLLQNGSFEADPHDLYWQQDPDDQIAYEPDYAVDGDWALVQGRSDQARDEVVYHCWAPGVLEDYTNFVLMYDWECQSTDIWQLNGGRMSFIYYDGGWHRFTNYFGVITHTTCGGSFNWHPVAWGIPIDGYTGYEICLSVESINPSMYWTHIWYDRFGLMGTEKAMIFLPVLLRGY